jgi:hypothetical protein
MAVLAGKVELPGQLGFQHEIVAFSVMGATPPASAAQDKPFSLRREENSGRGNLQRDHTGLSVTAPDAGQKSKERSRDKTQRFRFMRAIPSYHGVVLFLTLCSPAWGQEAEAIRPLVRSDPIGLQQILPEARVLLDATSIENFLRQVEGTPPDWAALHGGDGHDERLFLLNRERDRLRQGRTERLGALTFLWDGELSEYDPGIRGFHVAIGPRVTPTTWGLVRFKPDNLPSNLVAVPPFEMRHALQREAGGRGKIDIIVALTGRLVPEESIIYDFAHEEPGQGMVIPVIRIERLDYLLSDGSLTNQRPR